MRTFANVSWIILNIVLEKNEENSSSEFDS